MATTLATLLVKLDADAAGLKRGFKAAAGITAALGAAIVAIGVKSVKAFDIQAKAEASLLAALKGRKDIQDRLITQASDLQKLTLFGDEETIKAQGFLAQLGLTEDAIKKLTPLVQDFATAQGTKLSDAAKLVAKSVGSSTNALSRYGINIEGAVGSNERLESAVNALSGAFEGQAQAAAASGLGAFTQLKNVIGDLFEAIGKNLLPAVNELVKGFTPLVEKFQESAASGAQWGADLAFAIKLFFATADDRFSRLSIGLERMATDFKIAALEVKGLAESLNINKGAITGTGIAIEVLRDKAEALKIEQNALGKNLADTKAQLIFQKSLDDLTRKMSGLTNETVTAEDGLESLGETVKKVVDNFELFNAENLISLDIGNAIGDGSELITDEQANKILDQIRKKFEDAAGDRPILPPLFGGSFGEEPEEITGPLDLLKIAYEELTPVQQEFIDAGVAGFSQIGNLMVGLITGTEKISGVWKKAGQALIGIFADILKSLVKVVAKALALATIGNIITGGSFGSFKGLFNKLLKGQVDFLADGGLVTGPTLGVIGEAGPELVIPLNRLNEFGIQRVEVVGRISGNDLALAMERNIDIRSRRRGDIG